MAFTRVCIHYVWTTRYRQPVLIQPNRQLLFDHIRQNAVEKSIYIDRLNGYDDHVHCLVWLKNGQTIDGIAMLLKGESANWFNREFKTQGVRLQWQKGYFGVSVSLHMLERVRAYIDRQEEHHRKFLFQEEYDKLMKQYFFLPGFEENVIE